MAQFSVDSTFSSEQEGVDKLWPSDPDSSVKPPVQFPEVLVTATRFPGPPGVSPSAVSTLEGSILRSIPGGTMADVLAGLPGVIVRSYGGRGGVQTVSLRGATTGQTLVLIDGIRETNPQTGITDLGLLPIAGVRRIDVVRGGQSALYGADAVGGIINILTEIPAETAGAVLHVSGGSASYQSLHAALWGTAGAVGARGMILRERGRGDFPFTYRSGSADTTLRRQGADFTSLAADARFTYSIGAWLRGSTRVAAVDADRGSPGPVTAPAQSSGARLSDRLFRLQQHLDAGVSPDWEGTVDIVLSGQEEEYHDPGVVINGSPLASQHRLHTFMITPGVRADLGSGTSIQGGIELARSAVRSTDLADGVRWQRSVFAGVRQTFQAGDGSVPALMLFPSLRYDGYSRQGGDLSPRLGATLLLLQEPDLRLRGSVARSFRVPTFNELYWNPGGNPSLLPERTVSADAGVTVSAPLGGRVTADVSVFTAASRNRIIWLPGTGGFWSPRNSGRVSVHGAEAEAAWTDPSSTVRLSVVSTWTDARKVSEDVPGDPGTGKALPFTPGQIVHWTAGVHAGDLDILITHSVTSFRYLTEANDGILPGYTVTDASLGYCLSGWTGRPFLRLAVTNIFDTAYEIFPLYPMPLREFTVTLGGEL